MGAGGVVMYGEAERQESKLVACHRCRYYKITWQKSHPYACRAHGFKSKRNPSLIVYESSGLKCQLFAPK
jgi:hypothetical protein